jgi:ferredoxin
MTLVSANDPHKPRRKLARVQEDRCLGCGLCVRACGHDAVVLRSRPERVLTPVDGVHRALMMAIERGTLHDLIFDDRALWNHRAMAAVLGAILKLPPIKQVLANRQLRSRYLETLLAHVPH